MCASTSSGRPATGRALAMVRNDTGMADDAIVNLLEIDEEAYAGAGPVSSLAGGG